MANTSEIEAIVFDIGGTLFDLQQPETLKELSAGLRNAHNDLAAEGHRLPRFSTYRRKLLHRLLASYLWSRLRRGELDPLKQLRVTHGQLGIKLDAEQLERLSQRIYEPTKTIAHAHKQTAKTLAELTRRGYCLGVISNTVAPPPGLDDHLRCEGLLEYLPIRVYSCVVGVPKPHPRIFREAMRKLGVPASRAAYVGDKPRIDVKGARRIGMMSILRTPPGKQMLPGPKADYDITEIVDLLDLFPSRSE